jgi:hypothetical protein
MMSRRNLWPSLGALVALLAVVAVAFAVTGGGSENTSGPESAPPEGAAPADVTTVAGDVVVPSNVGDQVELPGLREVSRLGPWVALTGRSREGDRRCFVVQSAANTGYTSHGCASTEEIAAAPVYGSYWPEGGEGFLVALVPLDAIRVTANGNEVEVHDGLVLMPFSGDRLELTASGPAGRGVLTIDPIPAKG